MNFMKNKNACLKIGMILAMFLILSAGFVSADIGDEFGCCGGSENYNYGYGMMGRGYWGFGYMWIFMMIFSILILIILVLIIVWLVKQIQKR